MSDKDKTMEDIKSGKGLSPISNNSDSGTQSGITMEQRAKGITYETFTYHGDKNNSKFKGND
mgnify:CR=1 FL=1|jgi:hypothetical protein